MMTVEVSQALTAPFPPEAVGKLPRITCSACSRERKKVCNDHQKSKCQVCGNYITERHIHLDYIGHADVTLRLIGVDPGWTWEPMAFDDHGLPVYDTDNDGNPVGLWIKLTVAGVTRLGYGSCPSDQSDAVKVLIGDALRNAAMRFGVATDLWAKGDRSQPSDENVTERPASPQSRGRQSRPRSSPLADDLAAARAELLQVAMQKGLGSDPQTVGQHFAEAMGKPVTDASVDDIKAFVHHLRTGEQLKASA